jgi:hypothetical protein
MDHRKVAAITAIPKKRAAAVPVRLVAGVPSEQAREALSAEQPEAKNRSKT